MAGKPKKKPAAPKAPERIAIRMDNFVDKVAEAVAKRLNPAVPTCAHDYCDQAPMQASKPKPSTAAALTELAQTGRALSSKLLSRVFELDSRMRGGPVGAEPGGSSPQPSGLNEVMGETNSLLEDVHGAITRIGTYLGYEV